jgi:hypothetical protein
MSAAQKLNPYAAAVSGGHVERLEGPSFVVRGEFGVTRARRAPSCVLEPEAGDRVLLAHMGEGRSFVLAVLERDDESPQRWSADGDVEIATASGRVAIRAAEITMSSRVAKFALGKLGLIGEEVVAEVLRSRLVSKTIDSVAEVVHQTANRVGRVVTDLEHVRAGTVDIAAEKSLMIHAENAMVTAKALVKMDGEAIQMG